MTRVMATGVFDILHPGHLRYLQEARDQGDELVVVVATDSTVRRRKHEPITPENMRLELISALKMVDEAYLGSDGDMFGVVERIHPDIIALGYDQDFDEREIEKTLLKRGLKVKVVRMSKHGEDLNGTRKIIGKIIEWYSKNQSKVKED
ncbi:MAG TPA: adenylyltransferase/cytidyltransferase family protein [Methanomassiliicoccales archaeon]|nr:adenylyltransferase/cytidyltransferase family protein [Methanomassiliicoccales archaeon]HPR98883.1 adenylyltransferase/cytidyltransferase family protein [Methanomassiliicoccales archaeon]